MNNKTKSCGIGIVSILTIIFIVLKLTNNINWNWIWVLSPIWITIAIVGRIKKNGKELSYEKNKQKE